MADFQQVRNDLRESRTNHELLRNDVSASSYRLKMLERELVNLQRQKADNNETYFQKRQHLETQIAAERNSLEQKKQQLRSAGDRLSQVKTSFEIFIDPPTQLGEHFSNQIPFLLFPLRIETRFKTVDDKPQLWIRAYPDECLVDSFEPLLSKNEVNNAARFWAEYYGAGKPADPANPDAATVELQKAAWRLLVNAHGSGRAAWITRQLQPDETKSIFPVRGEKTFILAILSDSWNLAQQNIIVDLFKKIWFANKNAQLIQQIKSDFNTTNPGLDADKIIDQYEPINFNESLPIGLKREEADLQFAIVAFSDLDGKSGKEHGWSQPSGVNILPERLAVIRFKNNEAMPPIFGKTIPSPLPTSPDPSSDAATQFKQTPEGDLEFDEAIRWVADFDKAVDIGMGFRIDLAPDELNGFDKIFVLGVRLGADEAEGKKQLEILLNHHYFSKKGFSILPQGTPTNNTGSSDSGYSYKENADETFNQYFKLTKGFEHSNDAVTRADGQWLSEWLGIEEETFEKVLHSGGLDQADVKNMNIALWPATMGYVLNSMMSSFFENQTLLQARNFFNSYVGGRGPVPAIRIGNQPYGILPTTAFNRLTWINPQGDGLLGVHTNPATLFLRNLYQLLLKIQEQWSENLFPSVAHVNQKSTEVYKTLLDVLGLHPTSVEFHRRYLESLIEMSNTMSIAKPGFHLHEDVVMNGMNLLKTLGYPNDAIPQIVALLAHPAEYAVKYLIDDVPLSESKAIGEYTADKKNYIEALITQAKKSENALRTGEGLTKTPETELYRLLKYALELGYHTSAIDAAESKNAFTDARIISMRTEQPFTHQQFKNGVTESRYALLYQNVPAISPTSTVSEFIRESLFNAAIPEFSKYLSSQLNALDRLKDASTSRLERAFVEHLDCCSYRLDAWITGIITNGLAYMRGNFSGSNEEQQKKGIYLGAFGWLENVQPDKNKVLHIKEIPEELVPDFNPKHNKTFYTDDSNEGYIHTPSLNQAVTAAVLRNGYISHGKQDGNNVLAVNLSSERIRLALSVIEGIQSGQSLAALLGYHLERKLHDRDDLKSKKIDVYIYALRKQFPLVADKLKETKANNTTDPSVDPETIPITAIEARNVVHGVDLINHVKKQTGADKNYPFALNLTNTDAVIAEAITDAVNEIMDIADALGDLGIAESVHHIVMGNVDRAAGVLETYSKGNYPQEPDVIRTPRSGATLTHRVSIPFKYVATSPGAGPRAQTEPSIDEWLTTILPPIGKIVCQCSYISRADDLEKPLEISVQDIGLKPIDLLYTLHTMDTHALDELDDRFISHIYSTKDPRLDSNIQLKYTEEPTDTNKFSLFQIMPLIKSLRSVLIESVPLKPTDITLPNEASKKDSPSPELPMQRITDLKTALQTVISNAKAGVIGYLNSLIPFATATPAALDDIRSKIDNTIEGFTDFLLELSRYGIKQTGSGSLHNQRQQWFVALKKKLQDLSDRWQKNSDDYDLLAADPAPSKEVLQSMERLIAAEVTPNETITLAIVLGRKTLFDNEFANVKIVANKKHASLSALISDIQTINTKDFDILPFEVNERLKQIPVFVYDLQARAKALIDDLEKKRIPGVDTILSTLPALSKEDQAKETQRAAQIILGDDFKMVPRYALPAAQQFEIANSWNATNDLLNYLEAQQNRINPLEDWLHGTARVHGKMKHLENIILLRSAFDMNENDFAIHPAQLPFKTEKYHWLAMPFKEEDVDLEKGNALLYTAFTSQSATAPTEVCGMLVHEWTEIIPAKEETTGITFQYDRPNSEAPQVLLLVTPTQFDGNWQWNDLVDALSFTLDAAKLRAIEPEQIDKTPFATFLPSVIGAESLRPYSIVLDNKVHYMAEAVVKNFD